MGYAYKDKQREKQRKQALLEVTKDVRSDTKLDSKKRATTVAWSDKVERKANKEVKRSKKAARREHERIVKMTVDEKEREAETANQFSDRTHHSVLSPISTTILPAEYVASRTN